MFQASTPFDQIADSLETTPTQSPTVYPREVVPKTTPSPKLTPYPVTRSVGSTSNRVAVTEKITSIPRTIITIDPDSQSSFEGMDVKK